MRLFNYVLAKCILHVRVRLLIIITEKNSPTFYLLLFIALMGSLLFAAIQLSLCWLSDKQRLIIFCLPTSLIYVCKCTTTRTRPFDWNPPSASQNGQNNGYTQQRRKKLNCLSSERAQLTSQREENRKQILESSGYKKYCVRIIIHLHFKNKIKTGHLWLAA